MPFPLNLVDAAWYGAVDLLIAATGCDAYKADMAVACLVSLGLLFAGWRILADNLD